MPKLPRISGIQAVQAFQKAGWELARQRGSHVILTKPESIYTLSVPLKPVLGPGILRDLIGKAGLTVEEFRLQLFGEMTTLKLQLPKDKIVEFCRRWKITELALFGSVLRDDFRPDSNVDVLREFCPQC